MEITIAGQTWVFLASIVLGAVLGVIYDVFRILRIAVKHPPAAVLVEDILFWIVCAAATLVFIISAEGGKIRMFVLIGEMIGGILYYCTIGVLVIKISKKLIAVIRWIFGLIWKILIAPIVRLIKFIRRILSKLFKNTANWIKRSAKNSNIHLKRYSEILYNLRKHPHGRRTREKKKGSDG